MRKHFFHVTCVVIVLFGMFACESEPDLDTTLKFSKLSVEDQKQKIEQSGIEFIEAMENMKTTQVFTTMEDFMLESNMMGVPHMQYIKTAMESTDVKTLSTLDRQLRMAAANEDVWGEYNWNAELQDFEKVAELTNKIIVRFPSSSTDNTNASELTINYSASTVKMPDSEEFYPSSITCVLKINGKTEFEADFSGEYKTDGTPTKANHSMEMGDYKWTASLTNSTTELSQDYEFKYQTKTMVKSSISLKGDLTVGAARNSEGPDDIITYCSVNFQLMDVAIIGGIKDVKTFSELLEIINDADEKAYFEEVSDVLNTHLIAYAYFVKDKAKFADIEFFVLEDTYTWTEWSFNDQGELVETEMQETYHDLVPRFVLSDGSKTEIPDYFTTGFDSLAAKLQELMGEYNY